MALDVGAWYSAASTLADALCDTDGPETVAIYAIVKTQRVEKVVQVRDAARKGRSK